MPKAWIPSFITSLLMANWYGATTLLRKENRRFLKVWRQTIVSPIISSLLYFVVFAPIFGDRLVQGVPYLVFIAPGLVMMGVITNAFQNGSSSLIISKYQNNIIDLLMYPLSGIELLFGFVGSALFRGLLVGAATIVPVLFFLDIPFSSPLVMISGAFLVSFIFGCMGVMTGLLAKEFDQIALLQNFVITPLVFLGGVFFSVSNLPPWWQSISWYNPISHMIDVMRYGMIGVADFNPTTSLIFLAVFALIMGVLCQWCLKVGKGIKN